MNFFFSIFRARGTSDIIFDLTRELAGHNQTIKVSDIMEKCTTKGYTADQVDKCIEDYERLNVWQVNQTRTKITFI